MPSNDQADSRILLAISLASIVAFMNLYATQAILPVLAQEFRVSPGVAGLLVSLVTLVLAASSLVVGPLSDAVGRKPVMVVCAAALAAPTILAAFASSFEALATARVLQGIFIPGITSVALAMIPDVFPASRVGSALGVVIASNVVGGLFSRVVAGWVTEAFGWRWVFVSYGAVSVFGALALWLWLPHEKDRLKKRAARGVSFKAFLQNPRFVGVYVVAGAMFFAFIGMFSFLSFHLVGDPFRLSVSLAGAAYLTYAVGAWVSPRAGRLSDRFGRRSVMLAGLLVMACGLVLTLSGVLWVVLLGLCVVCFGNFSVTPAATALVGDWAGRTDAGRGRGAAAALYQVFYYVGGSLGGVAMGLAFEHWAWGGVIALSLVAVFLALGMVLLVCRDAPILGSILEQVSEEKRVDAVVAMNQSAN